ncbi:MAG: VOC family protein [Roseiflexus sp.]
MANDNTVDPAGHGSTVWMQEIDAGRTLRHAMHIDVSVAREQAPVRFQAALVAVGRIVDDAHAAAYQTFADRAGNRVCIVT